LSEFKDFSQSFDAAVSAYYFRYFKYSSVVSPLACSLILLFTFR